MTVRELINDLLDCENMNADISICLEPHNVCLDSATIEMEHTAFKPSTVYMNVTLTDDDIKTLSESETC